MKVLNNIKSLSLLGLILSLCALIYFVIGILFCILNDISCFNNNVIIFLFVPSLSVSFLGLICNLYDIYNHENNELNKTYNR